MGIKCGPSIANLYLYLLEINWLTIHRPLMYSRFIDDIFLAIKGEFNVNSLKDNFKYLKLNIENKKRVQFLDLNVQVNELLNELEFSLYTKPTNTFQYLHNESNHPSYIYKNLPKSLFIRIRRICTNYNDYLYYSREIIINLMKRGYKLDYLENIFIKISRIDRESLIQYKVKNNTFEKDVLRINMTYDHNYLN